MDRQPASGIPSRRWRCQDSRARHIRWRRDRRAAVARADLRDWSAPAARHRRRRRGGRDLLRARDGCTDGLHAFDAKPGEARADPAGMATLQGHPQRWRYLGNRNGPGEPHRGNRYRNGWSFRNRRARGFWPGIAPRLFTDPTLVWTRHCDRNHGRRQCRRRRLRSGAADRLDGRAPRGRRD